MSDSTNISGFFPPELKQFTVKLDDEKRKKYNRVAENIGYDNENYNNQELVEKIFSVAESKTTPKEVSLPDDIKKIRQLESEIEKIKTENSELKSSIESALTAIDSYQKNESSVLEQKEDEINSLKITYSEEISELKLQNAKLTAHIEVLENDYNDITTTKINLETKLSVKEKEIVVNMSNNEYNYLRGCFGSKTITEFFSKENISIENPQDILVKWFFRSVKLSKYPFTVPLERYVKSLKS